MASSVRISQLASVSAATDDDVFVINDSNTNTRKITYGNLTRDLVSTTGDQEINGNLTINGLLSADQITISSPLVTIDSVANAVGINTDTPQETLDVNGNVRIRGTGELQLGDYDNDNHVSFKAPAVLAKDFEYIVPAAYPTVDGQILASNIDGEQFWVSSLTDPTTSIGDMVYRDILNQVERLPIGVTGQILSVRADGVPGWLNAPPSFADPMENAGDMIIRGLTNTTQRIGAGPAGYGLIMGTNGLPQWQVISAGAAGDTSELQFNTSDNLDASANLTYTTSTNTLNVINLATSGNLVSSGPAQFNNTVETNASLTANGNTILGSTDSNTLQINSLIQGPILPAGGNEFGSDSRRWGDIYMGNSLNMSDGSTEGIFEYESLTGYQLYGQGVGGESARLRLYAEESNNGVTIAAPRENLYPTGAYTITLPVEQGGVGEALVNDGTGQLSWSSNTGSNLQEVTDNGNVTTNGILVDAITVREVTYPNVDGNADEVLATDGLGIVTFRDTLNGGLF